MSESKGIYAYSPRTNLSDQQKFKVMTWLESAGKEILGWTGQSIAHRLHTELGFPVSALTINRMLKGKRQRHKEWVAEEAEKQRIDLQRQRAAVSAMREIAPDDTKKQISIVARAVLRLYDGLGSAAPKDLEKIAYQNV